MPSDISKFFAGRNNMDINKAILKIANSLINFIIVIALLIAGVYASYALWDNNQIYLAAANVQADMMKLKPEIELENKNRGADFSALQQLNPDVCAWLTLDNTNVDYPVVQGADNLTYLNKDVYGDFALAGSIYLDSRNNRNFTDSYSLLYGHHMAERKMFGDLDLYKDTAFFNSNHTGTLITPNRVYDLEIFSCMVVLSSEDAIFEPYLWQGNIDGLLQFARRNSLNLNESVISGLTSTDQILAMSTCSYEFTDARTIILAVMR